MKFISKFSNYTVVLRPGIPSEPLTGRGAIAGLSVRFQDNEASVKEDTEIYDLLLEHPSYDVDFWPATVEGKPTINKKSIEPEHDMTEIKYGQIGRNMNPKPRMSFTDEQKAVMQDMIKTEAKKMALEMLKEIGEQAKKEKAEQESKKDEEVKSGEPEKPQEETVKQRGRPKKTN